MNKLPVFSTIGQTFGFVVERRFFTLLRLVWFPALITMIVSLLPALYLFAKYGRLPEKIQHRVAGASVEYHNIEDPVLTGLETLDFVSQLVLGSIIAVSIHRLIILDDRRPGTFFYLRLSKQEVLYVIGWIIYFVALMLTLIPFFGYLLYGGWQQLEAAGFDERVSTAFVRSAFQDPLTFVALGLTVSLAVGVLVRLSLTFPIIVAENRASFARSWALTRGNFWRLVIFWILFAILAAILLTFLLAVTAAAVAAIVGSVVLGGQAIGALGVLVFLVPAAVAFLVYFVLAVTLFVAALSFTYQALTDYGPPESAS